MCQSRACAPFVCCLWPWHLESVWPIAGTLGPSFFVFYVCILTGCSPVLVPIYVRVSVAVINTMSKSTLGWEGFLLLILPGNSPSLKEVRAGTKQGRMQELIWRLAPHSLLSLFSYSAPDHQPRDRPTHNRLGLPTSIINQEKVSQACLRLVWLGAFSQCSLFQSDSLCQVDRKLGSTVPKG